MSVDETHVPLQPLSAWLPTLAAARILDLTGSRAWARAHAHAEHIDGKPRAISGKLVRAVMTEEDGDSCSINVGMGEEGALACLCDCEGFTTDPPCGHVAGLLLALANNRPLRDDLSGGLGPNEDDPAREAKQRSDVRELVRRRGIDVEGAQRTFAPAQLLDLTFESWRRRGEVRPIGPATYSIDVEYDSSRPEEPPQLRVRVLPEGARKPFSPDELESRRLPATEWRILEPLAHSLSGTREFTAAGAAACTFLERAADAGLVLNGEGAECVAAITTAQLRPSLDLRDARHGELTAHRVVADDDADRREQEKELHEAWVAYTAIVGSIEEKRFLDLLSIATHEPMPQASDLKVLEAHWIAADQDGAPSYLPLPAALEDSVVFRGASTWVFLRRSRTFARVVPDVGHIALARLLENPSILLTRDDVPRLPAMLSEHFLREGIGLPRRDALGLPPLPKPHIVLQVGGSVFAVEARIEARYERERVDLEPDTCANVWNDQRDGEAERAAVDAVASTSLRLSARRGRRRGRAPADANQGPVYRGDGERAVTFWTHELPEIVARAGRGGSIDEIIVPADLRNVTVREPVRSHLEARSAKSGLMDVALAFGAEGIRADVDEIRAAMAAKRRWVKLTDGSIASLSGRVAELAAASDGTLGDDGKAELPRHALGETKLWGELADEVTIDETVSGWTDRLRALDVAATPHPVPGLRAELRSYQEVGLAWLQFLADLGVGGILADDMGLGKTIQALAVLSWRNHRDGHAPSLVVAPTSVAPNWIREAKRFVPDLKTLLLHGADRHARADEVPDSDIVVTTYALLRRDIQRLRDVRFRYVILDEAQHIKNHTAATTAAARALDAESRLALTGTPLENRLLELWSIVDFVNPGMLGTWREFSRRWERPVEDAIGERASAAEAGVSVPAELPTASGGAEAASLRARIRPFLLRRTKSEVQRDLPPKIESDIVVELTPPQRRAYAALAAATREDLGKRMASEGFEKSRMVILTALLRLRQMACDPRLVDPKHAAEDSAKLGAFRELVSEVIASGRRALVFSQFVQLLTLLREDLDAQKIQYAYLDGRTRDREAAIDEFVEGTMPVFLLSLRAGGTGINLSAADVVIHLDPWWNPAVEEQATDRAHRIGQEKTVSVYRIVAAGTIEEGILRLKERKRALARAVIGDGEPGLPRGLSESDIDDLLSF
ncbi:MAG: DEAD/DEAH box helicase [Candidatus Binatia bacterium]|nr:DEAD/DEAH box helicase [Candidatus Binatia bacterium]